MSLLGASAFLLAEEGYDGALTYSLSDKSLLMLLLFGGALRAPCLREHAEGIIEAA
jgi:hypothetical protein